MIIDVTGIEITSGNFGRDCLGNGLHYNNGELIECCCSECNYMKCCFGDCNLEECINCDIEECPRK